MTNQSKPKEVDWYNSGIAKIKLKDFEGAIAAFDKAIEHNQKEARAYIFRGLANSELKDYFRAMDDFIKAIELNPKDGWRGILCAWTCQDKF